jgi:hypothetical protein
MSDQQEGRIDRLAHDSPPAELLDEEPADDRDEWTDDTALAMRDDVWDAFKLDEETAEPEPEVGDFWGELDEDEMT